AVDEMLARLLAVAHDIDACVLLFLEPQQRRIALGLSESGAFGAPRRPELVRLGEPGRLRQAAGDGGLEHCGAPLSWIGDSDEIAIGHYNPAPRGAASWGGFSSLV